MEPALRLPVTTPTGAAREPVTLLVVDVDGHRCALPADVVVEIHPAVQLARLPDAPEVVVGMVNRRGRPLPVLDLRRRLGLPGRSLRPEDRLVVLALPGREVALLVDAAVDMLTVPAEAIDEAVTGAAEAARSSGVAVLPDGLLVILDVQGFLSSGESAALDEALQQALAAASR